MEFSAISNVMLDFITETSRAQDRDEVFSSLGKVSRHFGFSCFVVSGIPLPIERLEPYLILSGWPIEWYNRYLENNYVHTDPVILLSKTRDREFIWSDLLNDHKLDRQSRRVMSEASEFKMLDGLCVPLHAATGLQSIISFGAEKVDLCVSARRALYVLSAYALSLLREQNAKEAKQTTKNLPNITPREREIIQWCAAGKTATEIADILGRSHRTIQNEIFNLQRKLDVVNAPQMVAESFRLRILR
ncbi:MULTISPECIES: helix-turn-helix transcriptional regulator [Rhizobium]|uniref:LuxR family transcriptional regulator n=1 Tax=Rhizobium rhododendri TaxID=2506430 RepID=A0ABY8IRR9_9HYPH|nr:MULTISPECIES: LuxR family transcriptional regulator [Rhizobium]WFS26443.1 LuxR family transcriptional regulator [Rhizobium rhododendri]